MIFQRLIWCALAVAVLVGSVQTGVQQWQATPIIQAAESYESQKAAPLSDRGQDAAHAHGAAAVEVQWQPQDGAERNFWSWVAHMLHAFSMALLVLAAMGICLWRGARMRSLPLALLVSAAGWLSFHFWPSLGLPAEIPGMDAARLGSRQGWWVLAAAGAALACISLAGLRSALRWPAAAAWLALPFVVGAPQAAGDPFAGFGPEAQAALRALDARFIWVTTWISLSFWASTGVACGLAFERWLRPALAAAFGDSRTAPALEMNP